MGKFNTAEARCEILDQPDREEGAEAELKDYSEDGGAEDGSRNRGEGVGED